MTANDAHDDASKNVRTDTPTDTNTDTATGTGMHGKKQYHCPYCDVAYHHETLTRVHITRSDDPDHANRNGLMPETTIRISNHDDTETTGTSTKRPADINAQTLTVNDLPDTLTDRHKLIVLTATWNPYETEYTALKDKADELLENRDHDTLSYATVRRVIRRFYRPDTTDRNTTPTHNTTTDTMTDNTDTPDTLTDLTTKQQAILIATAAHPTDSNNRIATRIGTAQSYPSQVSNSFPGILTDLENAHNTDRGLIDTIANELTKDDITDLETNDLLANTTVNVEDIRNAHDSFNTDTDTDTDDTPTDRAVSEQNDVMAASPYTNTTPDDTDANDTGTNSHQETRGVEDEDSDTTDSTDTPPGTDDTNDSDTSNNRVRETSPDTEGIPREAVEQLRERIVFQRKLRERVEDQPRSNDQSFHIALTALIEDELNAILDN